MKEWYETSSNLHKIGELIKGLFHSHLYRLKIIIDRSPRGLDCGFAKASVKFIILDKETLINELETAKTLIEEIINKLKE